MLLRRVEGGWLAITQPAHAWLSGELARAWGGAGFAVPEPAEAVILASALHDIGWLEWERSPRLDRETGLPLTFARVPAEEHIVLWRRGVAQAEAYGAHVALLISRHGDSIYERTFDPVSARPQAAAAVRAFLDEQHAWQGATIGRLAAEPAGAEAVGDERLALTKRFIVAVDTLSLQLCWGRIDDLTIADVPSRSGEPVELHLSRRAHERGDAVAIHPWPFAADTLDLTLETRRLTAPSVDQAALDRALATAAIEHLELRLRRR